jgi:hypothetical protein
MTDDTEVRWSAAELDRGEQRAPGREPSQERTRSHSSRRRMLATAAAGVLASVAGCSLPGDAESTAAPSRETLEDAKLYVDEAVDLALVSTVTTVASPADADLVVLPDDTDVEAATVVEWLQADRAVALLGRDAEPTWIKWRQSDAFADAYGRQAVGDAEPDPDLVVGAERGDIVASYSHTWSDDYDDRDVLDALDEILASIQSTTTSGGA